MTRSLFKDLPLAHVTRGPGDAWGLLFVSVAAVFGVAALILFDPIEGRSSHRGLAKGAAVLAGASVVLAYAFPVMITRAWVAQRPRSTARLEFMEPHAGQVFHGDHAVVSVQLRLVGGTNVSSTSAKIVPNVGHVHLYLDGQLISMTSGLRDRLEVGSGIHKLVANFVASDHGPFNPPVEVSLSFAVVS
jgi:hypothetical protein